MTPANNIETEYSELTTKQQWDALYQKIRTESSNASYTCLESIKPQNKSLNRYRDVSPYDHSRIVLKRGTIDYVNANLVPVTKANRKYILTQGPLCSTVSHFWLMIWEQESKAVLMLNKLVEKKQEKCYQYWPEKIGQDHKMNFDDVRLSIEYTEYQDYSHYLTRTFTIHDLDTGKSRDIIQFHYTTWPDFGVPGSPKAFLEFLKRVRAAGVLDPDVGPAVVHCSAGIGRSGTFCLVDSCLVLIERFGINTVDVKEVLLEMRRARMGLIQTPEQLRFSYQSIIEGAKKLSQVCADAENCNTELAPVTGDFIEESNSTDEDEDDEPPPLPPPRGDSLNNYRDKPLPKIPASISLNDFTFNGVTEEEVETPPSRPLPVLPPSEDDEIEECSSADELEDETRSASPMSDKSEPASPPTSVSPEAELRHRQRKERKEQLAAQVRDMKRRQQTVERWTKLKRSLFKPLVLTGTIVIGGGIVAYLYMKYSSSSS